MDLSKSYELEIDIYRRDDWKYTNCVFYADDRNVYPMTIHLKSRNQIFILDEAWTVEIVNKYKNVEQAVIDTNVIIKDANNGIITYEYNQLTEEMIGPLLVDIQINSASGERLTCRGFSAIVKEPLINT